MSDLAPLIATVVVVAWFTVLAAGAIWRDRRAERNKPNVVIIVDRLRVWAYTTGPLGSPRSLHYEAADALDATEAEKVQWQTLYVEAATQCRAAEAKLAAIDALTLLHGSHLAVSIRRILHPTTPTEDQ